MAVSTLFSTLEIFFKDDKGRLKDKVYNDWAIGYIAGFTDAILERKKE